MQPNDIRMRVVLIALIPLAGMLVFAGLWTKERTSELAQAEDVAARTQVAVDLGDVMFHARSDAVLVAGIGDPRLLPAFEGLLRAEHVRTHRALEDALGRLGADRPLIRRWLGDGRWSRIQTALDGHRALERRIGAGDGRVAEELLWADANTIGTLLGDAQDEILTADGKAIPVNETLGDVAELPSLAFAEAQIVFPALLTRRPLAPAVATELATLNGRERAAAQELLTELPADAEAQVRQRLESPSTRAWNRLVAATARRGASGEAPPELSVVELTRVALAVRDYVVETSSIRTEVAAALQARSDAAITAARRDVWIAACVTALLLATTIGLIWLLVRSTTRGLGRLTVRARAITAGELGGTPLPESGPEDLVALTRAVNEMTDTLCGVEAKAQAIADGGTSDPDASLPLPGAIGASMDKVVARVAAMTEQLRAREALARAIVDTAAEAVWTIDADGVIRTANSAAARLTGYTIFEMVGRPCTDVPPVAVVCGRAHATDGGEPRPLDHVHLELPRKVGGSVPAIVSTRRIADEDGRPLWTVFAFDISERLDQERRLAHEASHDALTGLPNRASALRATAEALRAMGDGSGCGLLFVDLDRFKHVNDAQGHRVGDALLTRVAERLRRTVRPEDVVARLGGDEFLVVLGRSASEEAARAVAERAMRALADPFDLPGGGAWVSASIGVAWTSDPAVGAENLLREADMAMYRAKEHGRGAVSVFDESMRRWAAGRADIEQELRGALAADGLRAVFQPIVDLATGDVVAAELLARLPTATGEVPPASFIEIAEDAGMIVDVGRWALRTACARLAEWESEGRDALRIMVNISGLHLAGGHLLHDIREAARVLDGGLHRLGIEITESFLLQDERGARGTLEAVRAIGCTVALDDFGTGYSSLDYLRGLPVDVLKVDRSFVAEMEASPMDSAIVTSVAALARARGLRVVAEGIETEAHAAAARAAGCDLGQGYLYSRPVPFEELTEWVQHRRQVVRRP